jgi:4'-phosphopantetheinyl transferase
MTLPPTAAVRIIVHSWTPESMPREPAVGEIHLWWAHLEVEARGADRWYEILSRDERVRAHRFRGPKPRASFIVARGLLRAILGGCLRVPAGDLRFSDGPWGKPALAHPTPAGRTLHFNAAHSQGIAFYGVAPNRSVGVDVEHVRVLPNLAALGRRWLTPRELLGFDALEPPRKSLAFLEHWVRREAFAKATGIGLSSHVWPSAEEAVRWSVQMVGAPPGYVAALAYGPAADCSPG